MLGAIIGDIVGSVYEVNNLRTTEFELFTPASRVSDDSVMTIAVADALLNSKSYTASFRMWGRKYPEAGYGKFFKEWLKKDDDEPLLSFGNGAAMRVSPVAWVHYSLVDVLREAEKSAIPSHGHPDGLAGAKAIASSVFLARKGTSKEEIKIYIETTFGYNLNRSLDWLRANNQFDSAAAKSVPEAITVFLNSSDYENTIRNAVSIGGDTDTIACMAGGIAEAFYGGVPVEIIKAAMSKIPGEFVSILNEFKMKFNPAMFG
ncbi:hypothetical protein WSM22_20810 [Cytophagales bacterium WSM2-2]|nr:hypothetical protein WSM22_20810 [Cytophagales bacterium WSM2-2]